MRRYYFWIITQEPENEKPYLVFGSDKTEADAREKAFDMLPGLDFQIKRLPTRSLAHASAMIRGVRLEESHSLKQAGRRIGHDKSLKRRSKRAHNKFIGDRYFIEQY